MQKKVVRKFGQFDELKKKEKTKSVRARFTMDDEDERVRKKKKKGTFKYVGIFFSSSVSRIITTEKKLMIFFSGKTVAE